MIVEMIGVFFSLLAAIAVVLFSWFFSFEDSLSFLPILFLTVGSLFLIIVPFINAMALIPLQKAESKLTPRAMDVYGRDFLLKIDNLGLLLFALFSYLCAYLTSNLPAINKPYLFAIWLVLFGIATSLLHHFYRRVVGFLNPFTLVKKFTQHAIRKIKSEEMAEACIWIDTLAEIGARSVTSSGTSLATKAIDEIQQITNHFLSTAKSSPHRTTQHSPEKLEGFNAIHYYLSYVFQRLEMINDKAITTGMEPICHHMVTVLGKIALYASTCDLSLAEAPLRCLGYCAKQTQQHDLSEVGVRATYILVEVAKGIINDADITRSELLSPFKTLIEQLEEIAKNTFRRDKETNILVLMHPFQQLKELFSQPNCSTHKDTPAIIQNIDRVLGEFQALETIMQGVPSIPTKEQ